MKNIYLVTALEQLPRLLSLIDRNPISPTYGCLDRNFWQYKFIDFPCMRMQEAALTLAIASKIDQKILSKDALKELAVAAINFWKDNIAPDGSVSEWYPNEKSYVATAYSSFAVAAAALQLKLNNPALNAALKKSARWLMVKTEHVVQNQQSGAIAALLTIHKLAHDASLKKRAIWLLNDLKKKQSKEGWFSEYNGPDIGYLSLTVDNLAKSARLLDKKEAELATGMALKSASFLRNFLHPDYTSGGEYGSRNTEYLIPPGFEILSSKSKTCTEIALFIREALKRKALTGPYSFDDKYLAYHLYTFLEAALECKTKTKHVKFSLKRSNFPQAKIFIRNNSLNQIIINLAKGGSFAVFSNNSSYRDSGVRFKTTNGSYTTGFLNARLKTNILKGKDKENLSTEGKCIKINAQLMSPGKHAALRAFQITAGKYMSISSLLKKKLRNELITSAKHSKYSFKRTFNIKHNKMEVIDEITPAYNIKEIYLNLKSSELYIPSARFFNSSDNQKFVLIKNPKSNKKLTIVRTIKASKMDVFYNGNSFNLKT